MNKSLVLIAVAMVVCLSHVTVLHAVKANRVSNNKISSCLKSKRKFIYYWNGYRRTKNEFSCQERKFGNPYCS